MNIEQEFKELHELLLACYDEDYEESLDKALGKLDSLKKAITVTRCSTQLKDKEVMTFNEWTRQQRYKQDFFYFKKDNEYLKPTEVLQIYNTYKQNL